MITIKEGCAQLSLSSHITCTESEPLHPGLKKRKKRKIIVELLEVSNKEKKIRNWTCYKCSEKFANRALFCQHVKAFHSKKEKKHYHYDDSTSTYVCDFCSSIYEDECEVKEHVMKTHMESFSCPDCEETYASAYDYSCHVRNHSDDKCFKCPLCSYSTSQQSAILSHINCVHYNKFYYYCKTCGKGFNDGVVFKEHENVHLGIKPFECVVCGKAFPFSRYLLTHQIRLHSAGFEGVLAKNQCGFCLRTFGKEKTLEKHVRSLHRKDSDERKHLCDVCGKYYTDRDKLMIHRRVHSGVKPFSCQSCDKSFTRKDYLRVHERVHTGEKPYSCEYCGKCFSQNGPLIIHQRSHTGEKPYVCQFCDSAFTSRGALNIHFRTCTGGS